MENAKKAILMHEKDNVAVVLSAIKIGDVIAVIYQNKLVKQIAATAEIPIYHKIALSALTKGTAVLKYGEVIGQILTAVKEGGHIHVQQLKGGV